MLLQRTFEFIRPGRPFRELTLLRALAKNPRSSQRELGKGVDLTPAMVNQYILEFAANGYIAVRGDTNRSLRYVLTEQGRARMRDLGRRYAEELAVLHRAIRDHYRDVLGSLQSRRLKKAAIPGVNEKAKLVCEAARRGSKLQASSTINGTEASVRTPSAP